MVQGSVLWGYLVYRSVIQYAQPGMHNAVKYRFGINAAGECVVLQSCLMFLSVIQWCLMHMCLIQRNLMQGTVMQGCIMSRGVRQGTVLQGCTIHRCV